MFTADQLVAHAIGDYILQSEWMASNKARQSLAAAVHALLYTVPFLLLTTSPSALGVIAGVHFLIDRWALARYVIWLKNRPWPGSRSWVECRATGYPPETPGYMAGWLLVIVDNVLHVITNGLALQYFG